MLFIAAAMLGICSAFAFKVTGPGDTYVKVNGVFNLKSTQSGECITQTNSACNYVLRVGHSPNTDADFIYSTSENQIWVPSP